MAGQTEQSEARARRKENSPILRVLDRISDIPSTDWTEIDQYQELHGKNLYSVTGYQTILQLREYQFTVSLISLAFLNPTPSFFGHDIPFIVRVARVGEKSANVDYQVPGASYEFEAANTLFKRLEEEVGSPGAEKQKKDRGELREHFDTLIIMSDIQK